MKWTMLLTLFCLLWLPSSSFPEGGRSGYLVDAKCYETEENNVNPTDTLTSVDRDRDLEIRLCVPNAKTKSFAIVDFNGYWFKLDSAGNNKATELVRKTGKKRRFYVVITGEMNKNIVQVDSISIAK